MKKKGLVLLYWCMTMASASAQNAEEVLKGYMNAFNNKKENITINDNYDFDSFKRALGVAK
jgi:hypothetical protein